MGHNLAWATGVAAIAFVGFHGVGFHGVGFHGVGFHGVGLTAARSMTLRIGLRTRRRQHAPACGASEHEGGASEHEGSTSKRESLQHSRMCDEC